MKLIQEILDTPVLGEYDVIVCGGGISGISAAAAAARNGKSVLVLEKGITLGGLATIGLISWYEPLCDGYGKRVMNGNAYELLKLCCAYGYHTLDDNLEKNQLDSQSSKRLSTHFSPSLFAMALDRWLLETGAQLLLDTIVTRPRLDGNRVDGVFVENKDGRGYYRCKMLVDCTGDADIAVRCGLDYEQGVNYLTYIGYYSDTVLAKNAAEKQNMLFARKWMNSGADHWGNGHPNDLPYYIGINAQSLTDFVLRGRSRLFEKIKNEDPFKREVATLPSMAQYRKTNRIIGMITLKEEDKGKHSNSSIAVIPDFFNKGELYEIPYETLYNAKVHNLFVAGRAISSTGWAWDVTRVIPAAAATGEACGTACAVCCDLSCTNHGLPIGVLQEKLRQQGAWIHF